MDIRYLAGLIDGEGSVGMFSTGKGKHAFTIEIKMTQEHVIDLLVRHFGGTKTARPQPNGWKHQWRWRVKGQRAVDLYASLRPHLLVK